MAREDEAAVRGIPDITQPQRRLDGPAAVRPAAGGVVEAIVGEQPPPVACDEPDRLAHSSRAAQETEEAARQDRIGAYLTLLGLAVQHAVDALVAVNAAYGLAISNEGGLWFEFEKAAEIDKARAERDKMYDDTGQVRFTADYYGRRLLTIPRTNRTRRHTGCGPRPTIW